MAWAMHLIRVVCVFWIPPNREMLTEVVGDVSDAL
jgi:hypothetical protein